MSSTSTLTSRAARQHVVEPAIADVVGPAVAADDPDAAPDQVIDHRQQVLRARVARRSLEQPRRSARRRGRAARGFRIPGSAARSGSPATSSAPSCGASSRQQCARQRRDACRPPAGSPGRTRRCPRTASSTRPVRGLRWFVGPRRDRQVAAIDRGAAGGVGDLQRGRRTTATAASDRASRRSRRRRRRTRTAAPETARRAHWRNRPGRGH